jgi:tRNA(Ile)-lysidine synthase
MSSEEQVPAAVRRTVADLPGLERGLIVAVSGGPDSVGLLRALVAVRGEAAWRLIVAHANHGLRGADADADEAFVAALAAELGGLEWRRTRLDVTGRLAEESGNLEDVARRLRYDWLTEVARTADVDWVATGHTASDQAETVLHRLLRGSGLHGLRGIAARRPLTDGVGLVRPLLGVSRTEVRAYLEQLGQSWRHDESNDDRRRTRNRIRHELLPHLAETFNPGIETVLVRLAEQAEEACRAEDEEVEELRRRAERPRAGAILVFDRKTLAAAPRRLVRALFRSVWEREGWPRGRMGFAAWERLADMVGGMATGLELPDGVRVRCRQGVIQLSRTPEPAAPSSL